MNRREFLKWSASSLAAALVWGALGKKTAWPELPPHLSVVTGGTAQPRVEAAIKALGGINRFVQPGNRVVVKPNIAWARTPQEGANTDPEVVAAVVGLCRQAGARQVIVIDHTCNNYRMSYQQSGIEAAAKQAGAEVRPADQIKYYRQVNIPEAKILHSPMILNEILDCDVLINLPVVKVHGGAMVTLSMKNLMGVVWDRGIMHSTNLHQAIVDLSLAVKPKLILLDATRIMTSNGPAGPGNIETLNQLVAATDPVAADAYGAKILGFAPENIPHIKIAHQMRLGEIDLQSLRVKNVKLA
ncbi:MAG: DUF362 domain-containing protein [Candidatus Omnitrophota bacterium]